VRARDRQKQQNEQRFDRQRVVEWSSQLLAVVITWQFLKCMRVCVYIVGGSGEGDARWPHSGIVEKERQPDAAQVAPLPCRGRSGGHARDAAGGRASR
jgi:hypothetical protein